MADLRAAVGEEIVDVITGPAAAATTATVLVVAAFFLVAQVFSAHRYLAAALRVAGLLTAMLGLVLGIHSHRWVTRLDTATTSWFVAHRSAGLNVAALVIEDLGGPAATAAAVALSAALLAWRARSLGPGIVVIGTVGAAAAASAALKALTDRSRPPLELQLVAETGASFPAGHVTGTAALLGIVAVCVGAGRSRAIQGWLAAGVVGAVLLIAATLVYLGVHWLTDVAAGAILAAVFVTLGATVLSARRDHPGHRSPHPVVLAATGRPPMTSGAASNTQTAGLDATARPGQPRSWGRR